jgi:hypothetical protein
MSDLMERAREFKAYRITNAVSGKSYIGITRHDVDDRWAEHRYRANSKRRRKGILHHAIKSYGPEVFSVEHLCSSHSWDAIVAAERLLIDQYDTLAPNGYNQIRGVPEGREDAPRCFVIERKPMPQATREHLSRLFKGRHVSEETKAKRRETRALKKAFGLGPASQRGAKRSLEFRIRASKPVNGEREVSYAGVRYASVPLAAEAAGVVDGRTFRRWVEIFGTDVPLLSEYERHVLRHAHGRMDTRNRAHRNAMRVAA